MDRELNFQGAAAAGAESFHEAAPDQRRVARRLALAGLIIDLHRQQNRSALIEAAIEQFFEMGFVAYPFARGNAGAARHRDDIGHAAGRRLLPAAYR